MRVDGTVSPGFEPVREAFESNFANGWELGAACSVYHRGEQVVDLWGGVRDASTGAPWQRDTMAIVYSATKGMAGLAMALAHSCGLYRYDEPVCSYWPEFAQAGKERITVRQLLSHQAGLFALDRPIDRALVSDPDRLAGVLARQAPAWPPGTRQAYHGITLGFYEAELLRRVDPQHRSLGVFFQEELADPLGLDFYIRLPSWVSDERLARLQPFSMLEAMLRMPPRLTLAALNPRSRFRRCLRGSELPEQSEHVYARELEVPSGGGVGTARAMACAYGTFADGGASLGLRAGTLAELAAPPRPPASGFRDACLKVGVAFSLGFMKPTPTNPFGPASAYGAPGTGGSLGFADPEAKLGFAYVPNRLGAALADRRTEALRAALYRSVAQLPAAVGHRPSSNAVVRLGRG